MFTHQILIEYFRAAPGTDPNNLAPAAPATGEDGEIVGGPR
jgi:hypothetical protein